MVARRETSAEERRDVHRRRTFYPQRQPPHHPLRQTLPASTTPLPAVLPSKLCDFCRQCRHHPTAPDRFVDSPLCLTVPHLPSPFLRTYSLLPPATDTPPPKTQSGTTLGRPWAQQKGRAQAASFLMRSTHSDRDSKSPNLITDPRGPGGGEGGRYLCSWTGSTKHEHLLRQPAV